MGERNSWGNGEAKFSIDNAEFAVLCGGPYDGLKLSRASRRSGCKERQIGLPTPQFIKGIQGNGAEGGEEGVSNRQQYNFIEFDEANYTFNGDEVIAVYTSTLGKKKYSEVFDTIPPNLKNLSGVLNVTIFNFDFYAKFEDIDVIID